MATLSGAGPVPMPPMTRNNGLPAGLKSVPRTDVRWYAVASNAAAREG